MVKSAVAAICLLLCVAAPAHVAAATDAAEGDAAIALHVAAAMMTNDWAAVALQVPPENITQDPGSPLLDAAAAPGVEAFANYLSACRFFVMGGEPRFDRLSPPTTIQIGWLCPEFEMAEAVVSEIDGQPSIRFKKSNPTPRELADLQKSGRNADIVEGFVASALVEPDFKVGRAPRSEPVRDGEPSDQDLNEAALVYISAIHDPPAARDQSGLDHLNFATMSWSDRSSRELKRLSFAEVRARLRECRLFEGWPRRYDRDGERVFAFSSAWRCLGPTGPYKNTLFLEIADGAVAGGRFIENDSMGTSVRVPVAVRPTTD